MLCGMGFLWSLLIFVEGKLSCVVFRSFCDCDWIVRRTSLLKVGWCLYFEVLKVGIVPQGRRT